jgi:CRP-like cAMP-binding protein
MTSESEISCALGATDLFAGLNRRSLSQLAKATTAVTHPAGKALTSEGQDGLAFHLILSGTATVAVNGRAVETLRPGQYFGEIAVIDGRSRTATVTANSELRTASIVSWQFRPLLDEIPGLAKSLLLVMCDRLRVERELGHQTNESPRCAVVV